MRPASILLLLAGLSLALTACGQAFVPTPTALPLAATATLAPRATATVRSEPANTPTASATATATSQTVTAIPGLDDLLVRRQMEDFLARLSSGDAAAAFRLYVAPNARAGYEKTVLPTLAGQDPRLVAAKLIGVQRAGAERYDVKALLSWEDGSQEMDLTLEPEGGLWRITAMTLGEPQAIPVAEPTRRPVAMTARPPQALAGRLVFQVSSGGDIYTINADGSGLQRLADGLDPAWSPDGGRIAFTRWRQPWGVYVVQPDGTGSAREERVVDGNQLKEVAWAPDGKRLAFTINYSSPGGEEICFFGFCFTLPPFSVGQIWTVDLETHEFLSLPLDDKAVHAPAWNPAGTRLVYAGDRGLAWIDLGPESRMDKGLLAGGSAWDTSPSYSPDGSQITYMSRVHNRWEVFLMNADGSGRTQLTRSDPDLDPAPSNVAPAWSPDGKHIVFLSSRDGPWRIYVMNADGSGQRSMFGAALDTLGIRYEWATERVVSWGR